MRRKMMRFSPQRERVRTWIRAWTGLVVQALSLQQPRMLPEAVSLRPSDNLRGSSMSLSRLRLQAASCAANVYERT